MATKLKLQKKISEFLMLFKTIQEIKHFLPHDGRTSCIIINQKRKCNRRTCFTRMETRISQNPTDGAAFHGYAIDRG